MPSRTQLEQSSPIDRDEADVPRIPILRRIARSIRHRLVYDNRVLGLLVELKGNRVSIGGVHIDVSDDCIGKGIKGRFALGVYERPEIESIERDLDRSTPVIELGACLGVVSCITNNLLIDRHQHVVVEANSRLVPIIERNRELNGGEFELINAALAYNQDMVTFYVGKTITASALNRKKGKAVTVPTITLARILHSHQFDRVSLIVDIEGAEYDLVANELELLSRNVTKIFMEVHESVLGPRKLAEMFSRLEEGGFEVIRRIADNYVFRNKVIA